MLMFIIFIATLGLMVSLYAYFVERKLQANSSYHPVCDLSDRMSCTKPIKSEYGKLFGISNALMGMAYYATVMFFAAIGVHVVVVMLTIAAFFVSIYLAYLLYFRIRTVCILCTSTYVINIILLVAAYLAY